MTDPFRSSAPEDASPPSPAPKKRPFPLRPYFPAIAWALSTAAGSGALAGAIEMTTSTVLKGALLGMALVMFLLCIFGSILLVEEAE